jgi:hypothetical protein
MVSTLVAPGPALNTPSALAPGLEGLATCPSCHTQDPSTTNLAVSAGADWHCARCGWRWDVVRLATVAAYEVWLATRASSTVDPALHAMAAA